MTIPRNEHPNPQFMRESWLCLNGEWSFEKDNGRSGEARGLSKKDAVLSDKIIVPFCPESKLSGIEYKDFMYGVWYSKKLTLTKQQLSGRVLLHFGAVDYEAEIFVNGEKAFSHKGGYISFSGDITSCVTEGENTITVFAKDDTRDPLIPSGKQSEQYNSSGCHYTRTTGIWQTVWVEFVPESYIESIRVYPDTDNCSVTIQAKLSGKGTFAVEASYEGKAVGSAKCDAVTDTTQLTIALSEKHLWEVGCGRLYDLSLSFGEDTVKSYFGLRKVSLDGYRFLLNDKSVFQRLILDQGFYPDGIYTAPDDSELLADIHRSVACGFNGARLHEKVFEQRFLYHADREGYLVWGEYPNWGLDHTDSKAVYSILPEWIAELERDFNHPSIIGWCPFNETWDRAHSRQDDEVLRTVYKVTKAIDPTRPCIDTSGNFHVETDIFDVHDYEQDPKVFAEHYNLLVSEGKLHDRFDDRQFYKPGQPTFVSEYGGIGWRPDASEGWGYGNDPKSEEEFIERYKGLTDALLDNKNMLGLCYTQLTDVEQEQNGFYTYDRKPKFDTEIIRKITSRKAAIED